jgi:hypothetical protein
MPTKKPSKQTFLGASFEDEPFGTADLDARPKVRMNDGRVLSWDEAEAELFPKAEPGDDDLSDLDDLLALVDKTAPLGPPGDYVSIPEEEQVTHFNNSYDVRSLSVASKLHPRLVYIDCSMPRYDDRLKRLDGETADLWKYLAVHELEEKRVMAEGVPYLTAHTNYATPRERDAVEADCGKAGWKKYTEIMDGILDHVEHKKIENPPPDPHVPPDFAVGHHRSSHKH